MSEEKINETNHKSISPLVFISHDTRDAPIAEAFSTLLKRVSAGVLKSFRSSDKKGNQGIEYGVEWYPEIIKNIQNASDVVCLLTPNSIDRPWILFEAGMAKGKLNTSILGVAIGIPLKNAANGPFAQFQNCGGDEDSLCKLVFQLVDRIPNSEPDDETIKFHVQKFIATIEEIFKQRKENPSTELAEYSENDSSKLFEEIKVMFQDLPSRIDSRINVEYYEKRTKKNKIHPMMIEELLHFPDKRSQEIGLNIALSLLKDSFPWLYDNGIETIRILKSKGTIEEKETAFKDFDMMVNYTTHEPLIKEIFMRNSKDNYKLLREIPRIITKGMERLLRKEI